MPEPSSIKKARAGAFKDKRRIEKLKALNYKIRGVIAKGRLFLKGGRTCYIISRFCASKRANLVQEVQNY